MFRMKFNYVLLSIFMSCGRTRTDVALIKRSLKIGIGNAENKINTKKRLPNV